MSDEAARNLGGRPLFVVDWKRVDTMCAAQCTGEEIAETIGCSRDTLLEACKREHNQTFEDYFAQRRQRGFASLRAKQFELAMRGDKTMLVWLGKQYLGQTDKWSFGGKQSTKELDDVLQSELKKLAEMQRGSGEPEEPSGPGEGSADSASSGASKKPTIQ